MAKHNRPENQHFVPKGYLNFFCDPAGTLQCCILRDSGPSNIKPHWVEGIPGSLGRERNLYTVRQTSKNPFQVENNLAENIDGPIPGEIAHILGIRPSVIVSAERPSLIGFIAHQAVRVPAAMKFKAALEPHIRTGRIVCDFPNNLGPTGISKDAEAIGIALAEFTLFVKHFDGRPGTSLITSDRPIGLFALAESCLQASPVESGFPDNWAKNAICTVPLSTCCALVGFRGPKRTLDEILEGQLGLASDDALAAWINSMTADQAGHVYTCRRDARFLLPNTPTRSPGQVRHSFGTLEEFVPAMDAFWRANSVPLIAMRS